MNIRTLLAILVVGLLAAGSWWTQDRILEQSQEAEKSRTDQPDVYMKDFTVVRMGPDGKPASRVTASAMRHFPGEGDSELDRPAVTFYRSNTTPWLVVSESGYLTGDEQLVKLIGKVHISRKAGPNNRAMTILTSNLDVFPGEERATTREAADIRTDKHHATGIGMNAWFKDERVQLLSRVRSRHEP